MRRLPPRTYSAQAIGRGEESIDCESQDGRGKVKHVPAVFADYIHEGLWGVLFIGGTWGGEVFLHHHIGGTAHLALRGLGARLEVVSNGLLLFWG